MPTYRITGPDGKAFNVTAPEGASQDEVMAYAQRNFKMAAAPSATSAPVHTKMDPTDGMSTTERVLAGVGKAFVDTGRGVGQLVGLVSDEDVADARQRDKALMNTTAGKVGNFGGHVATALPTALIPGANTLKGAALIGSAQGLLQPVVGDESRIKNGAIGAAAGAGGVAAARAIMAGVQGVRAMIDPFTEGGINKIAGRMLQRFADKPDAILAARGGQTITGATPTLAEATGDRGLAQLQDALRAADPQFANQITQRLTDNNAARVATLQELAGDSAKRGAAEATRQSATAPLYRAATGKEVEISPALQRLLDRPSTQKALARAAALAKEDGRTFGMTAASPAAPAQQFLGTDGRVLFSTGAEAAPSKVTGQTLQDLKMGMDALLQDTTSGIAGAEANAVKGTRAALVAEMERAIPEFQAARTGYAGLSKPINAMDIGEHIARKATSNTANLAGDPRMQANALLGMLRDEPGLIAKATGRKGLGDTLDGILSPDQLAKLRAVASETDRAAAVAGAGNGPGSATAQRMASQNLLRQIVGPAGMPASWAESVLANTVIGKPFNLIYGGVAEPKIQQALARAAMDPDAARMVLQAAQRGQITLPQNMLSRLLQQSARATPSSLTVAGQGGE